MLYYAAALLALFMLYVVMRVRRRRRQVTAQRTIDLLKQEKKRKQESRKSAEKSAADSLKLKPSTSPESAVNLSDIKKVETVALNESRAAKHLASSYNIKTCALAPPEAITLWDGIKQGMPHGHLVFGGKTQAEAAVGLARAHLLEREQEKTRQLVSEDESALPDAVEEPELEAAVDTSLTASINDNTPSPPPAPVVTDPLVVTAPPVAAKTPAALATNTVAAAPPVVAKTPLGLMTNTVIPRPPIIAKAPARALVTKKSTPTVAAAPGPATAAATKRASAVRTSSAARRRRATTKSAKKSSPESAK